jgi:hypothetical protein
MRRMKQQQLQREEQQKYLQSNSGENTSSGNDQVPVPKTMREKVNSFLEVFIFHCGNIVSSIFQFTPMIFSKLSLGMNNNKSDNNNNENNTDGNNNNNPQSNKNRPTSSSAFPNNNSVSSSLRMNDTGDISPELKLETEDGAAAEFDLGNIVPSPSKLYQSQGFPTGTPSGMKNNNSKISSFAPFSARFCLPCQKGGPITGSSSSLNYLSRSRDLNNNSNNYENAYNRLDNNANNNNPSLSSIPSSSSSSSSRNFFSRIWSSFFLHTRLLPFWQYPSYEDEEQQEVLLELLYNQLQYELFHSNEI